MARKVDAHQLELEVQRPETTPPARGKADSRQAEHDTAARRHPAAAELLATPGALLNRTHLRELGLERRAVDAVFRALPVVALPGYSRPLIRAEEYLELVEHHTFRDDRVRPMRSNGGASAWITTRSTAGGRSRYRVMYRLGGRESIPRYGGSFATKREALARKAWVLGELAALRVPDLRLVDERSSSPTLAEVAERWQASRVDVAAGTLQTYRVALGRVVPRLGDCSIDAVDAQTVADLVAELHEHGLKKQTIRKTVSVLAMVLDHARVQPNPARDRLTVKLPREERRHVQPPTAEHIEAVVRLLPRRYRLPTLLLDATGMRIGELEALTWGDVDEPRGRWRIATSKTGRPRWVSPPPLLLEAVLDLCPREDRHLDRRIFEQVTSERLRTALTRACTAASVPAFSPHDLRHRRVSLLHLGGMPWARIGELVGHDDLVTTARTYTHVVADERELDYAELLPR